MPLSARFTSRPFHSNRDQPEQAVLQGAEQVMATAQGACLVRLHLHMHIVSGIVADALTLWSAQQQPRWLTRAPGRQVTSMQARDRRSMHEEPAPPSAVPPAAGRHCRITLAPGPESTRTARDFTTATLRWWHLEALIQDAVIVASELVTNAIRHGTPLSTDSAEDARVELSWWCRASRLICVVTDRNSKPPVPVPADLDTESGRGLHVVHALTVAWGWTVISTQEKAVWAAFLLPAPADVQTASPTGIWPGTGSNDKPERLPRRGRAGPGDARSPLIQQPRPACELKGEPLIGVVEVDVEQLGDAAYPVGHRVAVQVELLRGLDD